MSDANVRRYLATAAFHDRMAAAYKARGNAKNADAAQHAADLCRKSAKAAETA